MPNPVPTQGNIHNTSAPARPVLAPTPQQRPRPFVFSIAEFYNGAIIGLVYITPVSGYLPSPDRAALWGVEHARALAAYASQRSVARHAEHHCRTRYRRAGEDTDDGGILHAGGWRCPMASVAVSLPEGAWDGHWRQLW